MARQLTQPSCTAASKWQYTRSSSSSSEARRATLTCMQLRKRACGRAPSTGRAAAQTKRRTPLAAVWPAPRQLAEKPGSAAWQKEGGGKSGCCVRDAKRSSPLATQALPTGAADTQPCQQDQPPLQSPHTQPSRTRPCCASQAAARAREAALLPRRLLALQPLDCLSAQLPRHSHTVLVGAPVRKNPLALLAADAQLSLRQEGSRGQKRSMARSRSRSVGIGLLPCCAGANGVGRQHPTAVRRTAGLHALDSSTAVDSRSPQWVAGCGAPRPPRRRRRHARGSL